MDEVLKIIKNDPWLEPYADAINGRHQHAIEKEKELTGKKTLSDFATGYLYYGLHRTDKGWVFREWAPNATAIYLIGDFNDWKEEPAFKLKRLRNSGNWGNYPSRQSHKAPATLQTESLLERRRGRTYPCMGKPCRTGRAD